MDIEYLLWLQNLRDSCGEILTPFMVWLSDDFAEGVLLIVPFIVYWCMSKRGGMFLLLSMGISQFLANVIKMTFCVYRPFIRDPRVIPYGHKSSSYSFPSGHTMTAAPILGGLASLSREEYMHPSRVNIFLAWLLCPVMILAVMFSRNYLGAHTPQDVIAGLILTSPDCMPFSRQDVFNTCIRLAESEGECFIDPDFLRTILDENSLPSHSTVYREQEYPAYRVVSTAWIPLSEAICRMARIRAEVKRPLVTVDGPCASGKTTLAEKLARVLDAAVVHTDDFVIPHSRKTAERLAVPGGNCDAERLAQEVAAPWKQGKQIRYRKYDCHLDQLQPQEKLPDCGMLILEGSYSNLPILREYADLSLYVDTPEDVRFARLKERESPESLLRFQERWIPLENAYFNAYGIPDSQCVIIRDSQKSI